MKKAPAPRQWLDGDQPFDVVDETNREARLHARNVETLLRLGAMYNEPHAARRLAVPAAEAAGAAYMRLAETLATMP